MDNVVEQMRAHLDEARRKGARKHRMGDPVYLARQSGMAELTNSGRCSHWEETKTKWPDGTRNL